MSKSVFITGAGSGIGRATVQRFARQGWTVFASVRRQESLSQFDGCSRVHALALDVNDHESVESAAAQSISRAGRIDALINNAGFFQMGPLETSSMEQIRAQFETNVFGLIAVTKAFLPHMREQGGGTIVNLSSVSAANGYPFASVYSASKAAVALLTEALNVEVAELGIVVKAVLPGTHATDIFTKVDVAAGGVPPAYRPLLDRFASMQQAMTGRAPEAAADVVWRAVTDGRVDRVRYYAGPDATPVPAFKRVLGEAGYFRFFRRMLLKGPGRLMTALAPRGGQAVRRGDNVVALMDRTQP